MLSVILLAEYFVFLQAEFEIIGTSTCCRVCDTSPPSLNVPHPMALKTCKRHWIYRLGFKNLPVTTA